MTLLLQSSNTVYSNLTAGNSSDSTITPLTLSSDQADYVSATLALVVSSSAGSLSSDVCDAAIAATSSVLLGATAGKQTNPLSTQSASHLLNTLSAVHQQVHHLSVSTSGAASVYGAAPSLVQTGDIVHLVNRIASSVSAGIQLGAPPANINTPAVNVSPLVCTILFFQVACDPFHRCLCTRVRRG